MITSPFACSLDGFKKIVKEFLQTLEKVSDPAAIDNGMHCVGVHYLNIEPCPAPGSADEVTAVSLYQYASMSAKDRKSVV